MRGPTLLLILLLPLLLVSVQGERLVYDWIVDYAFKSPDCVEKLIISINGEFPGPTINATVGDTVVVNVHNKMPTEGVVIHWHGILQKGTPWADGAALISQCPINPEETFTYEFVVDHPGTFFYHGHFGMQRAAGLYGSIIVHSIAEEPFKYDGEFSILLNDWWHKSMYEQELGLTSIPFRWVGEPQSLLIEGSGAYNCPLVPNVTLAKSGDEVTCNATICSPHVLSVEAGKTYRLRIASVASLSALNFILEGHNMTVVEVSGHYVEPVVVDNLDAYSGDSFSVLFTADQDPSRNYWAGVNVRGRQPLTPTGLGILNYLPNPATARPTTPAPASPAWNDSALSMASEQRYKALAGYIVPLPNLPTSRHLFLLNTQNLLNGAIKWSVNNITYVPPSTPVLAALKYNLTEELVPTPPDNYTPGYDISIVNPYPNTTAGSGLYTFDYDDVVDVILQNANTLSANNSEIHPWHLHGHDFWVLGYGTGEFDSSVDYAKLNYANPPLRNTAPVFPYSWTVLRFVANNPGAWPFHCHIEPHFHLGMGVIFAEGVDRLPSIPAKTLGCGLTKSLIHV